MTHENSLTIVGNLTADPELRYTQNGLPVVNLTIAQTERVFDRQTNQHKDGETVFMRGTAWREMAEHIAESFKKGQRVIATGKLKQNNYKDREGNDRTSIELEIVEIGGSVRFGTTAYTQAAPKSGQGQAPQGQPGAPVAQPGAPVNYGAPQGGYGAPQQGGYGAPQGAPQQGGYGAPQAQPAYQGGQPAPAPQPGPAPQQFPQPAGVAAAQGYTDAQF